MSLPTSAIAYSDCYAFLDAAVSDEIGARRKMPDESAAAHFRMRCYQARKINREDNAKVYPKEHLLHGRSPYDCLTMTFNYDDEGDIYICAVKSAPIPETEIESLSGIRSLSYQPTLAIEGPKAEVEDELAGSVVEEGIKRRV